MFGNWINQGAAMRNQFFSATPFPLVVIDRFIDEAAAHRMIAEFPTVESMPKSRDYVFGSKHELSSLEGAGPTSVTLYQELTGDSFARFLTELTGWELFVDPRFHGGGFHQGGDGSFLDTHVDFNIHPLHPDWLRRLNILLYLNPDWHESWGGQLCVKAEPAGKAIAIAPLFNRAVIMQTAENTYHGYPKMHLPAGVTRKSIAAYAYELTEVGAVSPRTTGWLPEGAGLAKRALARNYNGLVRIKNRFFGSGTAANR